MVIRRSLRLSSTGNLLPVTLLIQNHALAWSDSVHSWNCPNTLVTVLKELTKPHVTKLTEIQSYTLKLGQPGPFLSLKQNRGHTVNFSCFSPSLFYTNHDRSFHVMGWTDQPPCNSLPNFRGDFRASRQIDVSSCM